MKQRNPLKSRYIETAIGLAALIAIASACGWLAARGLAA